MTPRTAGASAARRLTSARAENPGGEPAIPPVPRTPLVAAGDFGARLPAGAVAEAIAAGLRAGGWPEADVCLLADDGVARELEALGFDARMLDLQLVIEARDLAALQAAGRRLARQL